MPKFDAGRYDLNVELLARELEGALSPGIFLGLTGDDVVVVHLRGDATVEDVAQARGVVKLHNPKKKTRDQKAFAKLEKAVRDAQKFVGLRPGDLTLDEFMGLDQVKKDTILFMVWSCLAD